jgi:UDP-N-acetylmuramoyl-L-alanyl-D-glutamate--2,6-diaminopimelate ligase
MKELKDLLYGVSISAVNGSTIKAIDGLCFDSRESTKKSLFVAVKGLSVDGHTYIDIAINKGAVGVVCEELPASLTSGVTYVQVANSQEALAVMAANWYDHPSKSLSLIGVTGTKGKTTVSSLLNQLFTKAAYQ